MFKFVVNVPYLIHTQIINNKPVIETTCVFICDIFSLNKLKKNEHKTKTGWPC